MYLILISRLLLYQIRYSACYKLVSLSRINVLYIFIGCDVTASNRFSDCGSTGHLVY